MSRPDPRATREHEAGSAWRRLPPLLRLLVFVGLVYGLYQGGSCLVRLYVDHRIQDKVGQPVVDFSLRDTAGVVWRAEDLRGKWVVLHFFRSQCQVCIAERGAIHEFQKRLDPSKVVLLGVLLDRVQGYPVEMTQRTLDLLGYDHPVLVADQDFVDAFHGHGWAQVTPVTYVIDPTGRIVHALRGRQDEASLLAALPADVRGG